MSKPNSMNDYDFFRKCCVALGIPDPKPMLDKMIVFDYIIANTDRHYNNFGFIRNADTLEWIGPAPIFDNGNSLGFNDRPCDILKIGKLSSKPFKPSFQEQLKLVSDYSWIDAYSLSFIDKIAAEILSDKRARISREKQTAIISALRQRIDNVKIHLPIQYTNLDSNKDKLSRKHMSSEKDDNHNDKSDDFTP